MRPILIVLMLATPAFSQGFFGVSEGLCWHPSSDDFQNYFNPDLSMDHDWSPGYRVGLGTNLGLWKASWMYTSFGADDSQIWTGLAGGSASSYGDLDYQVHDFEVGHTFCLYPGLQTEAFAGFRWGQIDYSMRDAVGGGDPDVLVQHSNTDSYGARLGGKARYCLPAQFSIFGHGAVTGLWSTTENIGLSSTAAWSGTDDHENHGVDAAAGVAWTWGIMEIAGGYEWNWWANSIQRRSALSQPDYEDLLLEGAFLRVTGRF